MAEKIPVSGYAADMPESVKSADHQCKRPGSPREQRANRALATRVGSEGYFDGRLRLVYRVQSINSERRAGMVPTLLTFPPSQVKV